MWGVVVLVLLVLLVLFALYRAVRREFWVLLGGSHEPNPFSEPCAKKSGDLVTDKAARDRVIKRSFSQDKVPSELDAIVVGSGMGGLTAAAILARAGKRVLVLEQHDQAGGCCHTYVDNGFEFDTGIHYVGEMAEGTFTRTLFDELSDGATRWVQLEEVYDTVVIGVGGAGRDLRRYPIPSGKDKLMNSLLERFPAEEKAIREFFSIQRRLRKTTTILALLKVLPLWFARFLIRTGLLRRFAPLLSYCEKSLQEVLDGLTDNRDLKAVLAYSFGDYGTSPADASFMMHAALSSHFQQGGYYPVGGPSEIAFNMIPVIERAGGKVLVRAQVVDIAMNGDRAVGVRVKKGTYVYEILAPLVISDAGLHNTLKKLLPKATVGKFGLNRLLKRVRHGVGLMSVFIGLDGTAEELGLKPSNVWAFTTPDLQESYNKFVDQPVEDVGSSPVPLIFLSFPSTKDPTYSERYPGKSTCAIVTVTPYEWFKQWKDDKVQHRGDDYKDLKTQLAETMWTQVLEMFPQLDGRRVFIDIGTPLSNQFYLGTPKGEVYGVDHNTARFSPEVVAAMRPEIGIPGLFLTGQDALMCGFSGAMYGGVLCASAILRRNILDDLTKLRARMKRERKEQ